VGASIVLGVDAPPVFDAAEAFLDLVMLAIDSAVVRGRSFVFVFRRDAGFDAPPFIMDKAAA
jgi:hypothetical protein